MDFSSFVTHRHWDPDAVSALAVVWPMRNWVGWAAARYGANKQGAMKTRREEYGAKEET